MAAITAPTRNAHAGGVNVRQALSILIFFHFSLLFAMGLFRHWGNMTSLNDLGFFDQAVWGILHGQWFLDTNNVFGIPINWLSCHFNVFLVLFAPLYLIWPTAGWFILIQAIALSTAAYPIYLLAGRVHESEHTGLLWALIYLLNPFVLNAAAWDFHPVTLAVPFVAGALLAVEKKHFRLLLICCTWLLMIQEQYGIAVIGFGLLWELKHRQWRSALFLVVAGLVYTVLVLGFIMPALSPSGTHSMIVDPTAKDSRYGWLGGSLPEIVGNIAIHPISIVQTVISMGALLYVFLLAIPLLGLFFAAPLWILPGLADFAANTLSANPMPRSIFAYHSVTLIPILTVSASYGAKRTAPLLAGVLSLPITRWVLLFTAVFGYVLAPLPIPGAMNFWQPVHWIQTPDPSLEMVRTLAAARSSLSVQANVGAHFSQHRRIYRYPFKAGETDTIILWLDSPTSVFTPHQKHAIGTVAHHLQMNPSAYLASVECMLRTPDFRVVLWQEPWLVFSRQPETPDKDESIRKRLEMLRYSWKITEEEYNADLRECRYQ